MTQTSHYFLFYFDEDITEYIHPNITPIQLNTQHQQYFESRGFLQLDIETIPNTDNIGFLTPSFFRKSKISSLDTITNIQIDTHTIVGFFLEHYGNTCLKHAEKSHTIIFLLLWNYMLCRLDLHSLVDSDFFCTYSNLWVTKREIAIDYIKCIRHIIKVLSEFPDEWASRLNGSCKYQGKLLNTQKLKDQTGFFHYTYHPFICERIIGLFAMTHSYTYIPFLAKTE
jgi:hypothetical protein